MHGASEMDLVECPYDKSHHILRTRFQVHLTKCRNHKNVPKVVCPFNVTHILNKPELEWHVSTCPERQSFENFKHRDESTVRPTPAPPLQPEQHNLETTENWDEEPDVASYNPQQYVQNAPVLRNLQGASKSTKKQFREKERLRFLGIDN